MPRKKVKSAEPSPMVPCPRCGEAYDPEKDGEYQCPECGIVGSSACCNPGGNRCLCAACENAEHDPEDAD